MIAPPLERIDPDRTRWYLRGVIAGHVARYEHTLQAARGKRILDVACGSGYGCAILGKVSASVVGVDLDPAAVKAASDRYATTNIRFLTGNACRLPVASEQFDVVTSFETIEHLPPMEIDAYLSEVHRVLVPGGIAFISTPDLDSYSLGGTTGNRFHLHEFTRAEFTSRIGSRFHVEALYGQDFAPRWQWRCARAVAKGPFFRFASRAWRAYKMVLVTSPRLFRVDSRPGDVAMVLIAEARKQSGI